MREEIQEMREEIQEMEKCVSTFAFSVCRCNIEGEVYGGAVTLWWGAMRAH